MGGAATASDPREGHQIRGNSGETGSNRWNCETTSGRLETGSSESGTANSSLERHGQTGSDKEGDVKAEGHPRIGRIAQGSSDSAAFGGAAEGME